MNSLTRPSFKLISKSRHWLWAMLAFSIIALGQPADADTSWDPGDFEGTPILEVGEIGFQPVWEGTPLKFRVRGNELGPGAAITASFAQPPTGNIYFGNNGDFAYMPGSGDREEFPVTFSATAGGRTITQTVPIQPRRVLGAQYRILGIEPGPLPDSQSNDFMVRSETMSATPENFNLVQRHTRKVMLAGKTVVLGENHPNGLFESYHERDDLRELEIHADAVIVTHPVRFPGTRVTIRARHVEFQDSPGAEKSFLSTEPRYRAELPDQFANGETGLPAGDITILAETFKAPAWDQARLRAVGGRGQAAGLGASGTQGVSKARATPPSGHTAFDDVTLWMWDQFILFPPAAHQVVYLGSQLVYSNPAEPDMNAIQNGAAPFAWKPGNGTNARSGGQPGTGGSGGTIILRAQSSDQVLVMDSSGGASGAGAPGYTGGAPGAPAQAKVRRTLITGVSATLYTHTAVKGQDAAATVATSPQGPSAETIADYIPENRPPEWEEPATEYANSWLSPLAMRQVLSWIRTAYINNHLDIAGDACRDWLEYLEEFRTSPAYTNISPDWGRDFHAIEERMQLYVHRIASRLDYFGNPPGWAPLLSLEVNQAAFRQEIETAVNILYLNYWLGNVASNLTERMQGYATARVALQQEIAQMQVAYNEAVARIPDLQTEAANVQVDVDFNKEQLRILEATLLARAEANARGPWWKQAAKALAAICDVLPIPGLAQAGEVLRVISEVDPNKPWEAIKQVPSLLGAIKDTEFKEGFENLRDQFQSVSFDGTELRTYIDGQQTISLGQLQKYRDMIGELEGNQAPPEAVHAELQRLKAQTPEYGSLIDDIQRLADRKQALMTRVSRLTQSLGVLGFRITKNLLAIDALSQDFSAASAAYDQRAVMYLEEMGRRARTRLLEYHYYVKKSYEYRLLRSYDTPLELSALFDRFRTIAEGGQGAQLTAEQFLTLRGIYEDAISQLVKNVVDDYNTNPPERSAPVTFALSADMLEALNSKNPDGSPKRQRLNLKELGLFRPNEENIRIRNITIERMNVAHLGNIGFSGSAAIVIEHGGESLVSRNGVDYSFRHYNERTQRPVSWESRYDALTQATTFVGPSSSATSLLNALLGRAGLGGFDETMYFSRLGAGGDMALYRDVFVQGGGDLRVDELVLRVEYDFTTRTGNYLTLSVKSENDFPVLVQADRPDLSQRTEAQGETNFYYQTGTPVRLTAPARLGRGVFDGFVDQSGARLGGTPEDPGITVIVQGDLVVAPKYREPIAPRLDIRSLTDSPGAIELIYQTEEPYDTISVQGSFDLIGWEDVYTSSYVPETLTIETEPGPQGKSRFFRVFGP